MTLPIIQQEILRELRRLGQPMAIRALWHGRAHYDGRFLTLDALRRVVKAMAKSGLLITTIGDGEYLYEPSGARKVVLRPPQHAQVRARSVDNANGGD